MVFITNKHVISFIMICSLWLFIEYNPSAFPSTKTKIYLVRRELDLNASPTSSMNDESPRERTVSTQFSKDEKTQVKLKRTYTKRGKMSEEEKRKLKYEKNKVFRERYRFKYSVKGQEIAAKNLNPIEKAEYDKELGRLRKKRKEYRNRYFEKLQVGVENKDPHAIEQTEKNEKTTRDASRKRMRKVRALKKQEKNKNSSQADTPSQSFIRRMEPEEPESTPTKGVKRKRKVSKTYEYNRSSEKKYRQKFSKSGQEEAKLLDPESKAEYDDQLAKYRERKRGQTKRYLDVIRSLPFKGDHESTKRFENYMEKKRKRDKLYKRNKRIKKQAEGISVNKSKIKRPKPSSDNQNQEKSIIPDLNELPPPDTSPPRKKRRRGRKED